MVKKATNILTIKERKAPAILRIKKISLEKIRSGICNYNACLQPLQKKKATTILPTPQERENEEILY